VERVEIQGDILTMRPRRLNLAAALGFAAFLALVLYALVPAFRTFTILSPGFDRLIRQPWWPVPVGFAVFFVVSRVFRGAIVMDRAKNEIRRDGRLVCRFDQIDRVEVGGKLRVFVMNELAVVYDRDKRLSLRLYDRKPTPATWDLAKTLGDFLRVPVEAENS
jgi:hypothetical protein